MTMLSQHTTDVVEDLQRTVEGNGHPELWTLHTPPANVIAKARETPSERWAEDRTLAQFITAETNERCCCETSEIVSELFFEVTRAVSSEATPDCPDYVPAGVWDKFLQDSESDRQYSGVAELLDEHELASHLEDEAVARHVHRCGRER